MQKNSAFLGLIGTGLVLISSPVSAAPFTISTPTTSGKTLNNGETGTVTSSGSLTVSGTAIAVSGTSTSAANLITISNSGTIKSTTGRSIRDQSGSSNSLITNNAGGLIQSSANDDIALNVASGTTSNSTMEVDNYGTLQTLDGGGNGTTTPSNKGNQPLNLTVATGATTVKNLSTSTSTGVIWATAADAVRPGQNGVVYNDGLIFSNAFQGSSSDGVDFQPALGTVTSDVVINGYTTTTPGGTAAAYTGAITDYVGYAQSDVTGKTQSTIEGGRHGITGGQDINASDTSTYNLPFALSVTNNSGAKILGDNGSGINIDGVGANEVVTVHNYGTITGNGVTGDGDGVDVDGLVNLTNSGTIQSLNAYSDTSEGVTVGGGDITNTGTIEGSVTSAGIASGAVGRGITLAGVDKTEANQTVSGKVTAVDTSVAIQKIYANTTVTNSGTIRGDTDAGIAIAGVTGATNYSVTITNNSTGIIRGNSSTVAVIDGSIAVGGTITPAASMNNETVINYGTIQQDGTGAAISLGGGTNDVQVLGGAASINGDISGGTTAGSNTLEVDPTSGQTFTYSHALSNFSSVSLKSGTITLSGASTYTGPTTVSGGASYINNATGSGTGTGAVNVTGGAFGGTGIIQPGVGKGITMSANTSLISGGAQTSTTATKGLTLDNTVAKGTILDASIGSVNLTFALGAGTTAGSGVASFGTPNTNSSYLNVLDDGLADATGELKFATSGDSVTLTDLTGGKLQLNASTPYLLIKAGSNAAYAGLMTTGDVGGLTNQNGYVTNLTINNSFTTMYANSSLYLYNGDLEVVPEPSTTSLLLLTLLGGGVFAWMRRNARKA